MYLVQNITHNVVESISVNGKMERMFECDSKDTVTLCKDHMEDKKLNE